MESVNTKTDRSLEHEGDKSQDVIKTDASEDLPKQEERESRHDGAVPSTSSTSSATEPVESAPSKIQRARKRERDQDTDTDTNDEESKKYEKDSTEAVAEKEEGRVATTVGSEGTSETCPFPRLKVTTRQRRYRGRLGNRSSSSSSSSSCSSACIESSNERPHDAASSSSPPSPWHPDDSESSDDSMIANRILDALHQHAQARGLTFDSDDDTWSPLDSDDSDINQGDGSAGKDEPNEEEKKHQRCLSKEVPKHKWSVTKAVMNRQLGMHTRQQEAELFWQRCYGSLHSVKRLELMYKLEKHHGCVNAISFNQSGTRLASGSDDKKIIIWDWAIGKSLVTYSSGHTSNVFQAKFLPMSGDNHIVSSARDGQVRLAVLSSTGECRGSRRLAHHRRPVNKISVLPETPHMILSAGEDARVMAVDVRCSKQSVLVTVKDSRKKIGLYSVDSHPLNNNEFCVCGVDYYIRIYDKRKIDVNGTPMKKFCPSHIHGSNKYTNVTCALYNHDGTEIIGSYNDESLYLFDTRHSDGADFVHKYEGHRNSATVKSCDFYGPNSEYIMSGSDCGHIFFWDKNTEAIVQFMRGDEKGVVNALVGHPQFPILATSGLDSDVKIWVPSCEQDPEMKDLKRIVSQNLRDRLNDQPYRMDFFGSPLQSTLDPESNFGINISRLGGSLPVRARFLDDAEESSASSDSDNDGYQNPLQCPPS